MTLNGNTLGFGVVRISDGSRLTSFLTTGAVVTLVKDA